MAECRFRNVEWGIRNGELTDKATIRIPISPFPIGEDFFLVKEVAQ